LHPKLGGGTFCCQTTPQLFLHSVHVFLVTNTFLYFAPLFLDSSKLRRNENNVQIFLKDQQMHLDVWI